MSLLVIVLGLIVVLTAVIVVVVKRLSLNKESKKIVERMQNITPFQMVSECREDVSKQGGFVDIKTDMENTFKDSYVSFRDEQSFTDYYKEFYYEVSGLLKRLKTLNVEPPCECVDFVYDFENIHSYVKSHNERYIQTELDENKVFFDSCLKYPLDKQQRRSIVSDEDNCLVVSSAGSGKTSSIVGKVKYLIEVKHVNPEKILLISYTNKASAELTERMGTVGLRGYTFHKLAIDIISKTLRQKPLICDNTDSLIIGIYKDLLHDEEFKKSVVECFVGYQLQETESERQENERRQQLSEQKRKTTKYRSLIWTEKQSMSGVCRSRKYVLHYFRSELSFDTNSLTNISCLMNIITNTDRIFPFIMNTMAKQRDCIWSISALMNIVAFLIGLQKKKE